MTEVRARFRLVFFDVDSTLVTIEGIDVLAGGNPEIAALTAAAMNGEIPLDQVYGRRLNIVRPTLTDVERLGRTYTESLVTGAAEVIDTLHSAGAEVHLVTAGIAQAIVPLAETFRIPKRCIHAVALRFSSDGTYAGYDERSMLTRAGGKEVVVRDVRARSHGRAAFVGDGISDVETRPAVDLFIGFGGVVVRNAVRNGAEIYIPDSDLRSVLTFLINSD